MIDQSRRRPKPHLGHGWVERGERAFVDVAEQRGATTLLAASSEYGEMKFHQGEGNFDAAVMIQLLRALQKEFGTDPRVAPRHCAEVLHEERAEICGVGGDRTVVSFWVFAAMFPV